MQWNQEEEPELLTDKNQGEMSPLQLGYVIISEIVSEGETTQEIKHSRVQI